MHSLRFGAVLFAVAATAACDGGTTLPEEPRVAAVELTLVGSGGQSRTVTLDGTGQNPVSVSLPMGTSVVSAEYFRADGSTAVEIGGDGQELRFVASGVPGVSFAGEGAFGGVLTVSSPGPKTVRVQLFDADAGRAVFDGPFSFSVTS